jgi:cytochrome c-type biogenesis protein CcmH
MSLWFVFSLIVLACCAIMLIAAPSKKQIIALFFAFPLLVFGTYSLVGTPDFVANTPSPVEIMLAKAESHLAKTPDDLRGWKAVAPVYSRLQQFEKAVKASREIVRLEGASEENTLDLAEHLFLEAKGQITTEALELFRKYRDNSRSRYYLALAKAQIGDVKGAIADLKNFMETANEQEKLFLQQEIDRLSK